MKNLKLFPQITKHTLLEDEKQLYSAEVQEILNDLSLSSNRSLNSIEESENEEEMDFLITSKKLKTKKYSTIKNLKLSQWMPILFNINSLWNIRGFYWRSLLLFEDDLSKNTITVSVESLSFARYQIFTEYHNNAYPIQWSLGYEFDFLVQNGSNYDSFKKRYPSSKSYNSLDWVLYIISKRKMEIIPCI